jgi:SAM-dependent methyltransferase
MGRRGRQLHGIARIDGRISIFNTGRYFYRPAIMQRTNSGTQRSVLSQTIGYFHEASVDKTRIYIPRPGIPLAPSDIHRWFGNIALELDLIAFEAAERLKYTSYYRAAGLLKGWRRPFFEHHFERPLLIAVNEFFADGKQPRVLDLGCGTGSPSLLFALLGAHVVALDLDTAALSILHKRKVCYEELTGKELPIRIIEANAFDFNFTAVAPIDGIYSLFAFNMMQPSHMLIARLAPHVSLGGKFIVQDGNRKNLFNRLFRKRPVLSKRELSQVLRTKGFDAVRHIGGCALPPIMWYLCPPKVTGKLDEFLCRAELFAMSYLHLATRNAS